MLIGKNCSRTNKPSKEKRWFYISLFVFTILFNEREREKERNTIHFFFSFISRKISTSRRMFSRLWTRKHRNKQFFTIKLAGEKKFLYFFARVMVWTMAARWPVPWVNEVNLRRWENSTMYRIRLVRSKMKFPKKR